MNRFKALITLLFISPFSLYAQTSTISCPSNIIVPAESGKEGATVSFPASAEFSNAVYTPASGSFFRLGSHSIIVTDASGKKCSFTVTVTDNESPSLSPLTLSRSLLWPDNNKMKKVNVYYDVSDNGANVKTTLSVSSNATDGVKDWEVIDEHLVRLKTSRLPDGTARVYTITVSAVDDAGNKTTRATTIAVSKTMTAVAAM
jgi:hypothetical protein